VRAVGGAGAAIFDAVRRRETDGTTGPRMSGRFFGGGDFVAEDARTRRPEIEGCGKGVPREGVSSAAPAGKAPTFFLAALIDAIGADLRRCQIAEGGRDAKGELHGKPGNLAWRGDRAPGRDRKLLQARDTADVANAVDVTATGATDLVETRSVQISRPRSAPFAMAASWISRRRAGPPLAPNTSARRRQRGRHEHR
jgi:hypothetical protein